MNILFQKKRSYINLSSFLGFAFAIILSSLSLSTHAGKIISGPSASGADGFGGWNLDNVEIILNGTQGAIGSVDSWYDETDGAYNFAADSDLSYRGYVYDDSVTAVLMGYVLAKDWPVGEPSGIKIIHDDTAVKSGNPENCIMSTSYLDEHFLDDSVPQQVICSSPWQTHKRFKVPMLPTTVDGGNDSVDLVFNVETETGSRDYQVFQKINNWTGGRLEGFTVQVGFGVGSAFESASAYAAGAAGIAAGFTLDDLHLTVPQNVWSANQLAVFSVGLFGVDSHTGGLGFFDPVNRAGFHIDEYGLTAPSDVGFTGLSDTLTATTTLGSDYNEVPPGASVANQFGPWISNNMLPYGVFFDDDGNPDTDAQLLAWYGWNPALGDFGWMGGSQDSDGAFSEIPDAEILEMSKNLAYTMGAIDDLVNVGLNYIITIGDVSTFPGNTFTIHITPTADTSGTGVPTYVGVDPDPLLRFTDQDASVQIDPNPTFTIGDLLTARVGDGDLNTDPNVAETVDVTVEASGSTTIAPETLTLIEQGENRGVFVETLPEKFSNVNLGTTVTVTYIDANTGTETNVTKTASTINGVNLAPITLLLL